MKHHLVARNPTATNPNIDSFCFHLVLIAVPLQVLVVQVDVMFPKI